MNGFFGQKMHLSRERQSSFGKSGSETCKKVQHLARKALRLFAKSARLQSDKGV